MDPVPIDTILENLSIQQQEIEMLQAIFPGKKEIVWDDPTLLIDVEEYINSRGKTPTCLRFLSFDINIEVSLNEPHSDHKVCLRVLISLPSSYPDVHPHISIMSNELARKKQSEINEDLMKHISNLDYGEIIILNIITWLQENVTRYYTVSNNLKDKCKLDAVETEEELIGMWLYMHHIYNKEKRKNIIHWADELCLTGFSLPGKPGVVHVEGYHSNIEEYFDRLRRLSWKRMSCKLKEKCEKRIFTNFEELSFDVHGTRENHMDMGKFFLYLKEKGLGHMFKELFGVEGHG